ncbi:MAG TPA: helix-turn-helix domain-containing protein [Anaerolineae bacterium]|nr:helix-turn-helix domain-containing protein [Anaerolineae bacterium]
MREWSLEQLNAVTISDVLRLALPLSTTMLTGADATRRPVEWVSLLVTWDAFETQVNEGDLVLVPPVLQADLTLEEWEAGLEVLAKRAVGLVLFMGGGKKGKRKGGVPAEVQAKAEELDLPLFVVEKLASVRDIHQAVAALLVDRQAQTAERGMQLYRQLSEMSREGQGLEAMTAVISKLTGKLVVVQDKRLDVQAFEAPSYWEGDLEELWSVLLQRDNLPSALQNRKLAARTQQSHWHQPLPKSNLTRLISPIVSGDRARGYLSLIASADDFDLLDSLTVEHGAAACALEMARAKAVSEAKKALRGNFLEGLLAQRLPSAEIKRLSTRLDHKTNWPHAIITLRWDVEAGEVPSIRRLETLVNWVLSTHKRPSLVHVYGDVHVCVFQALRDGNDMTLAHDVVRRLQEEVAAAYPKARFVAGLAGPADSLEAWPQYHERAAQAMQLGGRLQVYDQLVEFDTLGVYRLLVQLEDMEAVQEFVQAMVGPLITYDQQHRSNLLQTLDAFFKHHGNISQTASSLFIHRNTLLYRLERIQELTERDLDVADIRLAFHLALKLWQLRSGEEDLLE